MMQPVLFCNCQPTIRKKSREVDKAFIYKEKLLFFIRENKEKRWGERVENENGKIGEMEKKGMEKCGWTAGEMFSII